MKGIKMFAVMVCVMAGTMAGAQDHKESNYDESKVPEFVLPAVLETFGGEAVTSTREWEEVRRPELLDAFAELVYGRLPQTDVQMQCELVEESGDAMEGRATRKQVHMTFSRGDMVRKALMLIYLPNSVDGPVPVFTMLNFNGNTAEWSDPDIIPSQYTDPENLIRVASCPVDTIVARGYGFATVHYCDFFPDREDGYSESVLPLIFDVADGAGDAEGDAPGPDSGAAGQAFAAWAWGCSRMLDYLLTDPQVDGDRIILIGHSRLGKTTLWAGAQDQRFAMVILNEAGCGGAALSKRCFGERVNRITTQYPHWFCRNFHDKFAWREDELPIDQHEALALIAPRPLYVASAEEDRWSDPRGEFLSAVYASPVYELYGYEGLSDITTIATAEPANITEATPTTAAGCLDSADSTAVAGPPPVGTTILNRIGYHIRPGRHDMLPLDWEHYLNFADLWLKK